MRIFKFFDCIKYFTAEIWRGSSNEFENICVVENTTRSTPDFTTAKLSTSRRPPASSTASTEVWLYKEHTTGLIFDPKALRRRLPEKR